MTQEQIDALPDPKFKPNRDMVLCQRVKQEKVGKIYLPEEKEMEDQVCRVLAVGDGLMLDSGDTRKPPCKRGDLVFVTPRDGFKLVINGDDYDVFEAAEIVGVFGDENVTAYGNIHC